MSFEAYNGVQLDDVSVPPESFEGLNKEESLEAIKEWFFENFEDPAHRTPYESKEGGYQYIWGGPYDAEEIIREAFEGKASEEVIAAVIDDIQAEGWEWTTAGSRIQPPEEDYEDYVEHLFNSMQSQITDLEKKLEEFKSSPAPGMGHNNPPGPINEMALSNIQIQNITINLNVLKEQSPHEADEKAKAAVEALETEKNKLGDYLKSKGGMFLDETIKGAANKIGEKAVDLTFWYVMFEMLKELIETALKWLHLGG
ncbi:MAG: hypothetical protein R3E13_09115 [Alphaproteobacteria bacterium]